MNRRHYFCGDVRPCHRDYSLPDLGLRHEMVLGEAYGERYVVSSVDLDGLLDAAFDTIQRIRQSRRHSMGDRT